MVSRSSRYAAAPPVAPSHAHERPQRSRTPSHMPRPSSPTPARSRSRRVWCARRTVCISEKEAGQHGWLVPSGWTRRGQSCGGGNGTPQRARRRSFVARQRTCDCDGSLDVRAPCSSRFLDHPQTGRLRKEPVPWTAPLAHIRMETWSVGCVRALALTIALQRGRPSAPATPTNPRQHCR